MSAGSRGPDLSRPPAFAAWLVSHLCIQDQVEELRGDLSELHARNARTHGLSFARREYWREALGLCVRRSRFAFRERAATAERAARLCIYWGRLLITLGILGIFALAAGVALALGAPKFAIATAGLLFCLVPEFFYVVVVLLSRQSNGDDAKRPSTSALR